MKNITHFQTLANDANAPRLTAIRQTKEYKAFMNELETTFEDLAKKGYYNALVVYTELQTWNDLTKKLKETPFFNYDFRDAFHEDMRNAGFDRDMYDVEAYPTVTFRWR